MVTNSFELTGPPNRIVGHNLHHTNTFSKNLC